MISLSVAKLKMFSPKTSRKRNISLNKVKKEKTNFFVESLDQLNADVYKYAKRQEMSFCDEPKSDHKVLHNIDRIFIKFSSISLGFSRFFRSYFGHQIFVAKGI